MQSAGAFKWRFLPADRFDEIATTWDRLNRASADLPFMSALFIRNLVKVFSTGDERIAVFGEPGAERAVAILTRGRRGVWRTWQPSQLPLGALIMERGLAYADLFPKLIAALPGMTLLVEATQQDPMVHQRPAAGGSLRTLDYIRTGWIEVDRDFDSYWKSCSKQLQQNMRTQRSRLTREGIVPSFEVLTQAERVVEVVEDFGRLESAGWKGAEGTAVRADNEQGRFYRAMLEDFCRAGRARMYRYRFGNQVVAVDLCIESEKTQVLLKTTYDESIKGLSPSSLMRQEAYRELFDENRIRRIEFYGRVMEWTTRWTPHSREIYHVNFYAWGFLPTIVDTFKRVRGMQRSGL